MNTSLTAAFTLDEVLKASWAMTKKHWIQFILLFLVVIALYVLTGIVYGILDAVLHLPKIVDNIFSFVVGVYVSILIARASLAIAREQKLDFAAILKLDGKTYLHALLATILFYLVCAVGLVLLIIPGIIAYLMFGFSIYSIVDKGTEAVQSLEDSMAMTSGNKLKIFLFNLILFLISLVAVGVPTLIIFTVAGTNVSLNAGMGPMVLVGLLLFIVLAALFAVLGMVSMSGYAYMYLKMRAKTPLHSKK